MFLNVSSFSLHCSLLSQIRTYISFLKDHSYSFQSADSSITRKLTFAFPEVCMYRQHDWNLPDFYLLHTQENKTTVGTPAGYLDVVNLASSPLTPQWDWTYLFPRQQSSSPETKTPLFITLLFTLQRLVTL